MFWRLLIIGVAAVLARGEELAGPSKFYFVSASFSDYGALFYYRVIDVTAEGPDARIRYVRVAPIGLYCPRMSIWAIEAKVPNTSPAQLAALVNPCAFTPGTLHAALKKNGRKAGVFEATSFGIVAQCGASAVSLELPIAEKVDLERLRRDHPEMARLWDLAPEITDPVFGTKDPFYGRAKEDDLALQRAGAKLVPELDSGRYDAGLAAAVRGNVGTWRSPSFRALLENYSGPIDAEMRPVPRLLDAGAYRFSRFVDPNYPALALQARVQGKVELQLTLEPATGVVLVASAVSGHPLLKAVAIDAARQWRFAPNSVDSPVLNLTLDFSLRCP